MLTSKQKVIRLAAWSIAVALAVLALKAFAWWVTGSVALYSDAMKSIVNVIAAAAALWAIRRQPQAGRPRAPARPPQG